MRDDDEEEDLEEDDDDDFPTDEAEILRLAQKMIDDMRAHPELFAGAPYSVEELTRHMNEYLNAREGEVVAHARAERAHAQMERAFEALMRGAGVDPDSLDEVSEPPGDLGYLEVTREGEGSVTLSWHAPRTGGTPALYLVQSRRPDVDEEWDSRWVSVGTEAIVTGQEEGVEYEYQVYPINRVGEGGASNVVRATP